MSILSSAALKNSMVTYRLLPLSLISIGHLLNDLMTSVLPAMLPILKIEFGLTYMQLGIIILVANASSSLIQPLFGYISDRKPLLWLLPTGVFFTGLGLASIAFTPSYPWLLAVIAISGIGSAAFHPEASRGAHLAAGKGKGFAQSIFQVGGNGGQALGPLMIPLFLSNMGSKGTAFFIIPAILAMFLLLTLHPWMKEKRLNQHTNHKELKGKDRPFALSLLVFVVTMRSWVIIGITSFLPLYYINILNMTVDEASIYTFIFLFMGAIGTFLGGPLADKFGKKFIVNGSLLLAIPFIFIITKVHGLPGMISIGLFGLVIFSSFAVTVVFGQELIPGKVGMASGLMLGFAIGAAGVGAMILGYFADTVGLLFILNLLGGLLITSGLISLFLPNDKKFEAA